MNTLLVLLIVLFSVLVHGEDVEAESNNKNFFNTFSFIVIGSGAAGSVVGGRLAEETNEKVLVIEGGALGSGQRDIFGTDYTTAAFKTNPATGRQELDTPWTRYDIPTLADTIRGASDVLQNVWPITGRGFTWSQAKVVGGNQATNGLNWIHPQKVDFDAWGIPEYNSTNMWPYIRRTENATETGYGNSPDRGNAGRTNVKYSSFIQLEQLRFQNACIAAGYQVRGDVNTGTWQQGVYQSQLNTKAGIRQSTSILYLAPVLKRFKLNLRFKTSAVVREILFDENNNAIGVEYHDEIFNVTRRAYATKEVILAAGDLQVNKILYNSGIGPKSILNAFGKPERVINEVIGQKIRNHQRASMAFFDPTIINANFFNYAASSVQFARTGTGPIEDRALILFHLFSGISAPTPYPDIQAIPGLIAGATPTSVYTQGFGVSLFLHINKYDSGKMNLTTSDPLGPTNFTANLFSYYEDAERVARGILKIREIIRNHWDGNATETAPGLQYQTIPQLVDWIRANAGSACHYYGSAPIGPVVDLRMRLKGVQRLRIVGSSVVPAPVSVGMQSLVIALAERATDFIKQDYNL